MEKPALSPRMMRICGLLLLAVLAILFIVNS